MNKHPDSSVFGLGQRNKWSGPTHARRRKFRRMISASHHITFFLGKRFPNAFPLVFVLGYPKSGTSWVCQLVSDYLRLPFPQHNILPVGCPAVVHGHDLPTAKYPIGVYAVRDGRDVIISSFHHLRNQFEHGGGKRAQREFFKSIDLTAPISKSLPKFIELCSKHPSAGKANWGNHFEAYHQAKSNLVLVKYEDLLADTRKALSKVITTLTDEEVEPERIEKTVQKYCFTRQSGREKGTESDESYLRKGESGDWNNHFSPEAAKVFDQCFGTALIKAGYEDDSSWVEKVGAN